MYDLPADSEAAIAADSAGWTVPTSELAIDRLLKALDRHPLQGPWWQSGLALAAPASAVGLGRPGAGAAAGGHHLLLQYLFNRSQRRLLKARHQLEQKGRQLAQARRLAELGELGANVAHEINQPLSAIANYSQGALLRLDKLAQDPAQSAAQASPASGPGADRAPGPAHHPDRQPAQSQAAKRPPASRLATCPPWWRSCAPCWSRCWRRSTSPSPLHWRGQPRPLPLDGTGMEQLLVNLIKNGAESAAQRARLPTPAAAQEPARVELLIAFEAQRLLLEIRDNGAGLRVPTTELQQAFYSDKPDGMGLGLAICREVVESHRGQFSLENLSPPRLPGPGHSARAAPETLPSSTDMPRN